MTVSARTMSPGAAHMYIAELERELSILRHDFDCVVAALHREIRNNRQTTDPHDEETT